MAQGSLKRKKARDEKLASLNKELRTTKKFLRTRLKELPKQTGSEALQRASNETIAKQVNRLPDDIWRMLVPSFQNWVNKLLEAFDREKSLIEHIALLKEQTLPKFTKQDKMALKRLAQKYGPDLVVLTVPKRRR